MSNGFTLQCTDQKFIRSDLRTINKTIHLRETTKDLMLLLIKQCVQTHSTQRLHAKIRLIKCERIPTYIKRLEALVSRS